VALVAQFQTYCRELHDEAVEVHVTNANPRQADVIRALLTQGRKLEYQTPRTAAIGDDFGRLGFAIVEALKAHSAKATDDLRLLDLLVDFRNAISHGNQTEIESLVAIGQIKANEDRLPTPPARHGATRS